MRQNVNVEKHIEKSGTQAPSLLKNAIMLSTLNIIVELMEMVEKIVIKKKAFSERSERIWLEEKNGLEKSYDDNHHSPPPSLTSSGYKSYRILSGMFLTNVKNYFP